MSTESTPDPAILEGIDMATLRAFLALQPKPQPWPEFCAELDKAIAGRSDGYRKKLRGVCEALAALGVKTTFDLDHDAVDRYVASRPPDQSPWTLAGYLTVTRTICNHAVRRRKLLASPFDAVPIRQIVRRGKLRGKRHLSRAEIGRLLEVLRADIESRRGWPQWRSRRLHMVVCLGLYAGLRKDELLHLCVDDFDFEASVIRLKPNNRQGRFKTVESEAPVPIPDALLPIIRDWLAHRLDAPRGFKMPQDVPWFIPDHRRRSAWIGGHGKSRPLFMLKEVASRAGIDHMTLHMLRRSCGTHLQSLGVPVSMVARILRHTSEEITEMFYQEADEAAMVAAVKNLVF